MNRVVRFVLRVVKFVLAVVVCPVVVETAVEWEREEKLRFERELDEIRDVNE